MVLRVALACCKEYAIGSLYKQVKVEERLIRVAMDSWFIHAEEGGFIEPCKEVGLKVMVLGEELEVVGVGVGPRVEEGEGVFDEGALAGQHLLIEEGAAVTSAMLLQEEGFNLVLEGVATAHCSEEECTSGVFLLNEGA